MLSSVNNSTFYIVLPSNTKNSSDLELEHNKPNNFRVILPKKIQFDNGPWLCGLKSIVYPNSWPAIGTTETQYMDVVLYDGQTHRFQIPKGSYLTPQQLESGLRNGIIKQLHAGYAEKSIYIDESAANKSDDVIIDGFRIVNPNRPKRHVSTKTNNGAPQVKRPVVQVEEEITDYIREENEEFPEMLPEEHDMANRDEPVVYATIKAQGTVENVKPVIEKPAKEKVVKEKLKTFENLKSSTESEKLDSSPVLENSKSLMESENDKAKPTIENEKPIVPAKTESSMSSENLESSMVPEKSSKVLPKETLPKDSTPKIPDKPTTENKVKTKPNTEKIQTHVNEISNVIELLEEHLKRDKRRDFNTTDKMSEMVKRQERLRIASEITPVGSDSYIKLIEHVDAEEGFFNQVRKLNLRPFQTSEKYNKKLREELELKATLVQAIYFEYLQDIDRFNLNINDDRIKHVRLSDQISYVLGYEAGLNLRSNDVARYACDLRGGKILIIL